MAADVAQVVVVLISERLVLDGAEQSGDLSQNIARAEVCEEGAVVAVEDIALRVAADGQEDFSFDDRASIKSSRRLDLQHGFHAVDQVEGDQNLAPGPPVSASELVFEVDEDRVLQESFGVLVVAHEPDSYRK